MAVLSQAPRTVVFAGKLLMKGFNSILAPVERLGNSLKWHFLINKDLKRMSYGSALKHSTISSYDEAFFAGARHFIGWSPSVSIIAGKRHGLIFLSDAIDPNPRMRP